ncbi:DUF6087 family protein [Streptomyces sp. NPDC001070]
MDDEPLERWVRRREEEQERKVGRLRVSTLASGTPRGSHVDPDAPRLVSRWDGYAWQPVSVVPDLAETRALLYGARHADQGPPRWKASGRLIRERSAGQRPTTPGGDRRKARLRELLDGQDGFGHASREESEGPTDGP